MLHLPLFLMTLALTDTTIQVDGPPRRIVTDAGAGGYQAFPDVCRLKSGELFCVFYAGSGHVSHPTEALPRGGRICSIRSADEGRTWSVPSVVADTPDDDRDPSVYRAPGGELLCTFFTYGSRNEFDTCLTRSRDGGRSWSEPEVILPGYATSSPIRRIRSGRLLLPVYFAQSAEKRSFPAVCLSDDGGRTWSSPHPIGLKSGKTLDECDFFERSDGSILAVMREVMCRSESRDGGRTWTAVEEMGFRGHCPYLLQTRQGVLLLAHRIPQTALHYSEDEGRTWVGPIAIDDVAGAYPSMVERKDGSVLCVYYEEGSRSAIRCVTLRVQRKVGPVPGRSRATTASNG